MKHNESDTWGWMLAADFFAAGMGGAMLLITGLVDLFGGPGRTSLLANIVAPLCIALGACLLILELGQPLRAWRVFINPKAILTIGAWCMTLAIGFGFLYASFGIPALPWSGWSLGRQLMALGCAVFGLIVATYPGILLGRHKGRPFWNGPGMMVLFFLSSLVTGASMLLLCGLIAPPADPAVLRALPRLAAALLGFQLFVWPAYLWMKITGATEREALAARHWTSGERANSFRYGFLAAGTLLAGILLLLPGLLAQALGALLAVLGGLLMRLLVVYSGQDRTWLPGEQRYRSRLPHGDEAFLKALK